MPIGDLLHPIEISTAISILNLPLTTRNAELCLDSSRSYYSGIIKMEYFRQNLLILLKKYNLCLWAVLILKIYLSFQFNPSILHKFKCDLGRTLRP